MSYREQFKDFVHDKNEFFASVKSINDARERAYDLNHHYGFIATNQHLIQKEFDLLFKRLKEDAVHQEIFWFYCYYCCILLENFHHSYNQKAKADEYLRLKIQIKKRCISNAVPTAKTNNDSFLTFLAKKISDALVELINIPFHTSTLKDFIGYWNVRRIYWIFCRLTLTGSFKLARDLNKLENFNLDVDKIVSTLEYPNAFFRVLSVGFFFARLLINAGLIVLHVLNPSEQEKNLAWTRRLSKELYKRHGEMLNDIFWGPANLICNYNSKFGISDPTAGWITVGFLIFDLGLIIWRRFLAKWEYEEKRLQLTSELESYQAKLHRIPDLYGDLATQLSERARYEEHCRLLQQQIKDLDLNWQTKEATFYFNGTAALLLVIGFSLSLMLTPLVLTLPCHVICLIGVSMYLSDGAYSLYKEKKLLLEQAELEDKNVNKVAEDYSAARNELILTLIKNTAIPALTIALYAICWQAALVLTVAYFCYQLYTAYTAQTSNPQMSHCMENEDEDIELAAMPCF